MLIVAVAGVPTAGAKPHKGKIRVCYVAKGPDKGAMRFTKGKKCKRGEKGLTWNKKAKPGVTGAAGPQGEPGAPGAPGGTSQDNVSELRTVVEQQSSRIQELEAQVTSLDAQLTSLGGQLTGLGDQLGLFKTSACDQLDALTDQSNAMGVALDAIGLGGTIPALLTFNNPGPPTALPTFSC